MELIDIELYKNNNLYLKKTNVTAKYNNNIIDYKDDVNTKIEITDKNILFQRSNDEYEFKLLLNQDNNTCTYKLKKEDIIFDIKVNYATSKIDENTLEIIYDIETDDTLNKLIIVKK